MNNNCPNCNRRYGIEKEGSSRISSVEVSPGKEPQEIDVTAKLVEHIKYHCTACNAHWLRPKEEVERKGE